jgi:hypothetical protein
MKKSLPARPNLDHLSHTFIEHLPAAKKMEPAEVQNAGVRLADAPSAAALAALDRHWRMMADCVDHPRRGL